MCVTGGVWSSKLPTQCRGQNVRRKVLQEEMKGKENEKEKEEEMEKEMENKEEEEQSSQGQDESDTQVMNYMYEGTEQV